MIDLKNRIIFVHIPKTGGTSIEHFFRELRRISSNEKPALGLFLNSRDSLLERNNGHCSLSMYEKFYFDGVIPKDFRIFTVVRNPVTRFWSEHSYRRLPSTSRCPITIAPSAAILKRFAEKPIHLLKDLNSHLRPQHIYIEGKTRDRIRILKFENLNEEFALLCRDWDLPFKSLPKYNSSKKRKKPKNKDQYETWVKEFYKLDFSSFGYVR